MSIDSILQSGRDAALRLMQDTCTIVAAGSSVPVYDPATNTSSVPTPEPIYSGPVRVQLQAIASDRPLVAGDSLATVRYVVSVPIGAVNVPKGATITVTASAHDPGLVGTRFTVRSVLHKSQATALRMECEKLERET